MNNPKPDSPLTPIRAEMAQWKIGHRVMVRLELPSGSSHRYTDVIGYIRDINGETLTLESRSGLVQINVADVAIGKLVPEPPPRRRPRALP